MGVRKIGSRPPNFRNRSGPRSDRGGALQTTARERTFVMRSIFVVSSLLALGLVVGCSAEQFTGTPAPSSNPEAGAIPGSGETDGGDAAVDAKDGGEPDAMPDVSAPPGCDLKKLPSEDACVTTEASGVFVSKSGSGQGDGSRTNPLASIAAGIAAAKTASKRVYVCAGTYAESVTLENGVSVFGGFDCSTWAWNAAGRVKIASPTSPTLRAVGIATPTRVEGFDVVAPAGSANAPSSIGFIVATSPALAFVHGSITAAAGYGGAAGVDAVQLANGFAVDGSDNVKPFACGNGALCIAQRQSTPGGVNTCVGKIGYAGGPGGEGGSGGQATYSGTWVTNGIGDGAPFSSSNATTRGGVVGLAASPGAPGAVGTDGVNGASVGVISTSGYVTADGTPGTDGAGGQGGGGGRGIGMGDTSSFNTSLLYYGAPGTGGGAGGCPGLAGTFGRGGGASIAVIASDSPMTFDDAKLASANGGDAGAAGASTVGTNGGIGGNSLIGAPFSAKYNVGAVGGAGGRGGLSGQGGGGPSISYAVHGTAPTFLGSTFANGVGGAGAPQKQAPAGTIPASPAGFAGKSYTF